MKYTVNLIQTITHTIVVTAKDEDEAANKAQSKFDAPGGHSAFETDEDWDTEVEEGE